ncbi:hypothetical protein [Streptomyces sp. SP18CS02]|uniref:hypothetical protein n=1 Tax=Streptomyces sp. SP18CS02 TaxID=3002531 RepID=UPI002E7AA9BB|nr:hypothetical protein [Streptomyces sp. SP18CS02]MEE1754593.1 hypothetical protein [Streptomyces sp. SP18CS02]
MNDELPGPRDDGPAQNLFRALSAAHRAGDDKRFRELCRANADWLDAHRVHWTRVPERLRQTFRRDPERFQAHGRLMIRVARELDAAGRPAALRRITGGGDRSPHEKLHEAEVLAEAGEHAACRTVLLALLGEWSGNDAWAAEIHSRLAVCAARTDDLDSAVHHAGEADRLHRRAGRPRTATTVMLETALVARALRAGTSGSVRLAECREAITQAQILSDRGRYAASNRVLRRLLAQGEHVPPGEDPAGHYRGKIYGLMGLNHFRSGDRPAAAVWTRAALEQCRHERDELGVAVYQANLDEIDGAAPGAAAPPARPPTP